MRDFACEQMENKKRKLDDISSTRLDQSDIDRLLEEADNDDIEMLTAITLKQVFNVALRIFSCFIDFLCVVAALFREEDQ